MQGGVIAEWGTHDGLLASGGVYAALVRRQLLFGGGQGEGQIQSPWALWSGMDNSLRSSK